MTRAIPNINTAHLTLRAMRPEDFDRFAEIWATPEVVRHIGGQPWSRGRAWESFLRNAGHWQITGFGQWAVVEQRTRRVIGQTGFFFGARALGEDFDPFPEAGWILAPETEGAGLGLEAAEAAHDWFDRVIPGPLVAKISPRNTPSLKLAAELGYAEMRQTEIGGESVMLLRRNGPPRIK
ncbi:GNAT family N-acetyltransferase [Sedimentitalea nanhaiensis]|uniref:Protein N-acetyltransferase, RimJ/RimL family n=1 Tax=Sedimentitalea nanhaiensis TaxID=999627 RepID=A0A1I6Y1T0_9RHOB|nr:GNAT family N-acetyltransferase [Sedimentitalea nanhaiensis]SFT44575.1 Protein N-acetyltransferase, RimJ/RimL family [Sedimentitalea nanhaiensis]